MRRMRLEPRLVAGHLLCEVDGRWVLLDTGSPASFGGCGELSLLGVRHALRPDLPEIGLDLGEVVRQLRALPGVPEDLHLDALVGCDLLRGCTLALDLQRGAAELLAPDALDLPPAGPGGGPRPCVAAEVLGARCTAFVDTGARLSYALPRLLAGGAEAGAARDFMCAVGQLDVPLRTARVAALGGEVECAVGVAPARVAAPLEVAGVQAILGTELLARLGPVRIAIGRG